MATDTQAKFDIEVVADARQARDAANELQKLQDRVRGTVDNITAYREELKKLRSQSGDTNAAQAEMRAKLEEAKGSLVKLRDDVSKTRGAITDFRDRMKAQSAAAKESAERQKAVGAAMKAAGGPLQELRDRFESLKTVMGGGSSATAALAGGLGLLVVAVAAVTAGAIAATVAFAKWALGTADAARSLGLLQEAAAGSAENSAAMTSQIDAMARVVPTSRAELQKLYMETYRLGNFTTMSGRAIQDTYQAIAQSSAAMGDTVGKQIGDLITRSKQFGVVRIMPLDVQGTGLDYEKDLVAPLAKSMAKTGPITAKAMADARAALQVGGLKIDAGAKVVADAVNKRFGSINARQMLSLDVQWKRLHETIESFTRGIDLGPLLAAVDHFFAMFKPENDVGKALKEIVEWLGNGMVDAASKGGPAAESFFKELVIDALKLENEALKGRNALSGMFKVDGSSLVRDLRAVVEVLKVAVKLAGGLYDVVDYVSDAIVELPGAVGGAAKEIPSFFADFASAPAGGSSNGTPAQKPSSDGAFVAPANADGGVVGRPAPGEFWASVAPGETIVPAGKPTTAGGSSSRRVSGELTVKLIVQGDGGRPAGELVEAMRSSGLLADLTDLLESMLQGGGVPVGAASP